jgi:hypothetical protein
VLCTGRELLGLYNIKLEEAGHVGKMRNSEYR